MQTCFLLVQRKQMIVSFRLSREANYPTTHQSETFCAKPKKPTRAALLLQPFASIGMYGAL